MRKTLILGSVLAAALLPGSAFADGGSQDLGQVAGNQQAASSTATSTQHSPSNQAIHVAILSPGATSGNVTQSNSSGASSTAGNSNTTTQNASQNGGGGGQQGIGQAAYSQQAAQSEATSTQDHPSNQAIHVAILSPGAASGNVSQSNGSAAQSTAGNANGTSQNAAQNAGGGGGGGGTTVQDLGQAAKNQQAAESEATSTQVGASNEAITVSILSPHSGAGNVSQSNSSSASSTAGNANDTDQNASQNASGGGGCAEDCPAAPAPARVQTSPCDSCDGHGGTTVQGIGQLAESHQAAGSEATSAQYGPSNVAGSADPLSMIKSAPKETKDLAPLTPAGGNVSQSNSSSASSTAGNANDTDQNASQNAGGPAGTVVQGLGQAAFNAQQALSSAESTQWCPTNVAFWPFGNVSQSNGSAASSTAGNANGTTQNAAQNAGYYLRKLRL